MIMMKEGQVRIPSGCAIAAVISRDGKRMTGEKIIDAMRPMHERSNGLGGGFAGYGIYPEYRDFYALHLFFDILPIYSFRTYSRLMMFTRPVSVPESSMLAGR